MMFSTIGMRWRHLSGMTAQLCAENFAFRECSFGMSGPPLSPFLLGFEVTTLPYPIEHTMCPWILCVLSFAYCRVNCGNVCYAIDSFPLFFDSPRYFLSCFNGVHPDTLRIDSLHDWTMLAASCPTCLRC